MDPKSNTALGSRKRPRRGGRVYAGCDICRLRKIKCDNRKPTCSNCERSRRYTCGGYEQTDGAATGSSPARSSQGRHPPWSQDAGPEEERHYTAVSLGHPPDNSAPARMTATMAANAASLLPDERGINRLLREFNMPAGFDDAGPLIPPRSISQVSEQVSSRLSFDNVPLNASSAENPATVSNTLIDFSADFGIPEDVFSWPLPQQTFSRLASRNASVSPSPEIWRQPRDLFTRNAPSNDRPRRTEPTFLQAMGWSENPMVHMDSLDNVAELSADTWRLLHHWKTHVSQLMMPTLAPSHNPWLGLYLPMALQEPRTAAKKCLLLAILAATAFNKAELASCRKDTHFRLARGYRDQAAMLLKHIVDTSQDGEEIVKDAADKQALLAAALTMTTVEVFGGHKEGIGYMNLVLAKRIIKCTGGLKWWLSEASNNTLLQIFQCYQIICYTTGWIFPDEEKMEDQTSDPSVYESPPGQVESEASSSITSVPREYTLDVSFGISMQTLSCLKRISDLIGIKAKLTAGETWTENQAASLMRLEADLFDVLDDPDAFSQHTRALANRGRLPNYISQEIAENHVWAFHYSTALFYLRALCDGGSTVVPSIAATTDFRKFSANRLSGQALVCKALEHLENVDALSRDIPIANTLWAAFIAAVEAVDMPLRHRALIWFARAARHGIGNIAQAKALVQEVWRQTDRQSWVSHDGDFTSNGQLGLVDWREVMREKGSYIMLT